jgi:GSH-dependent disulfide-bond oxidoreductase
MYDVYAERSPSVAKVPILLEELGADYNLIHLDVSRGAQFDGRFAKLSPNCKIPVLVDHQPPDRGEPIVVWESGAILLYLAEKSGWHYFPKNFRARTEAMSWLLWQATGLSPMCGQAAHFFQYELPDSKYSEQRYWKETNRLFGVLDQRLRGKTFVLGNTYSIVDIACYTWVRLYEFLRQNLASFSDLQRWATAMAARAAVNRAYERIDALPKSVATREERFKAMCGHDATSVR